MKLAKVEAYNATHSQSNEKNTEEILLFLGKFNRKKTWSEWANYIW